MDPILLQKITSSLAPTAVTLPFAGPEAPEGWLMCDGAAISRVTYAGLFAVIGTTYGIGDGSTTFNLPDFRGEFARGADDMGTSEGSRGIDGGRVSGSTQSDATAPNGLSTNSNGSHSHSISDPGHNHLFDRDRSSAGGTSTGNGFAQGSLNDPTSSSTTGISINSNGNHSHSISGDSETRPRNIALNYIIKV